MLRFNESVADRKLCKECGLFKPLNDFYKCETAKDGRLNICKACKLKQIAVATAKRKLVNANDPLKELLDKKIVQPVKQKVHNSWTTSEVEYLTEAVRRGLPYKSMANVLGRTEYSVSAKIHKLGLSTPISQPKEQIQELPSQQPVEQTFTEERLKYIEGDIRTIKGVLTRLEKSLNLLLTR